MTRRSDEQKSGFTRRDFLATAAGISAAAIASTGRGQQSAATAASTTETSAAQAGYVAGTDVIKVGVIGCGGRGTGAAGDCVASSESVVITALGDLFPDKIESARAKFSKEIPDRFKATPETCFTGFDAYENLLKTDVDLVILATPPGFRPGHLRAAVEAGKHVFCEKPVAVDPAGIHSVIKSGELAAEKGLAIVAGTQRRHDPAYIETINRIHDGEIGDLVAGNCYWCQELLWMRDREPAWSDVEWQIRNWLYFDWLSGDHIVEQHVHNLDVMNWLMGGPPVSAYGMGGRQARTDPDYGNIYDHFAIEYEYANGARVQSFCRQTANTSTRVSEWIVGTKGTANPAGEIKGPAAWKYEAPENAPKSLVLEHRDLIKSIRDGKPLNDAKRIAESTMTALMGRMSAYTGRQVTFKWAMNSSKLDLTPARLEFGPNPINPVPVPGHTLLV